MSFCLWVLGLGISIFRRAYLDYETYQGTSLLSDIKASVSNSGTRPVIREMYVRWVGVSRLHGSQCSTGSCFINSESMK